MQRISWETLRLIKRYNIQDLAFLHTEKGDNHEYIMMHFFINTSTEVFEVYSAPFQEVISKEESTPGDMKLLVASISAVEGVEMVRGFQNVRVCG